MIQPIIDFEIQEFVRFYGALIGTPGMSQEIVDRCNTKLKELLDRADQDVTKYLATKSGLITS